MNRYIESFKHNEVLDALRIKPDGNFTVQEGLGYIVEIPQAIGQLIFGKYRLVLVCDMEEEHLSEGFESDNALASYIQDNCYAIYDKYIKKYSDYVYTLNTVPVKAHLDSRYYYKLLEHIGNDIKPYMPIIQMFIANALADNINT